MARKKKHEEHVNHERWLVSYADFITLLFAFFVVMYSISSVNDGKYRVLSDSLTSAFRQQPHSISPIQPGDGTPTPQGDLPIPGSQSVITLPMPDAPRPDDSKPDDSKTDIDAKADDKSPQVSESDKLKPTDVPTFADPKMGEIADKITAAMTGLIKDDLITVRRDERWLEVEIKSSMLLLVTSIHMGVTAEWWKKGWCGLSFLIMIGMIAWMLWYARKYYSPIRRALGSEYMTGFGTHNPAETPESMDVVYALVAKTNPRLLAWAGLVVTAVLLFLMRFKPF